MTDSVCVIYHGSDGDFVHRLHSALDHTLPYTIDLFDTTLAADPKWRVWLDAQLDRSLMAVLILTSASLTTDHLIAGWVLAVQKHVPVLIVQLDDTPFDGLLKHHPFLDFRREQHWKELLYWVGELTLSVMLLRLYHQDPVVRRMTAELLGRLRDRRGVFNLVERLRDPVVAVRHAAARSLAEIGDEKALFGLLCLLTDKDPVVVEAVSRALDGFLSHEPGVDEALPGE